MEIADVVIHDGPVGIGVKPISEFGSKRLIREAIDYALANDRDSVTLVHKGNIMKFTEGAFRDWGYEVAEEEYGDDVITEDQLWEAHDGEQPEGTLVVKDRIADNMLQQLLTRTDEYSVIATMNLNGDYMSDAAGAQIGGLGIAPGINRGHGRCLAEPVHGSAPKYAGQDKVNPTAMILPAARCSTTSAGPTPPTSCATRSKRPSRPVRSPTTSTGRSRAARSSRRASSPTPSSTRSTSWRKRTLVRPEIADFREHRITVVDRFSGLRPPTGGIEKLA